MVSIEVDIGKGNLNTIVEAICFPIWDSIDGATIVEIKNSLLKLRCSVVALGKCNI